MTFTPVRSPASWPLLAIALACMVLTAPVGHADEVDDHFLSLLHSKGINFESPQAAISAAHEVCNELDHGRTKPDVATEVMSNSNLDGYHAGYFIGASVRSYCPGHAS